LLKEGESGFHKLYINEKNEYNQIYQELLDIENIIYGLSQFRHVLSQDEHHFDKEDLDLSFVIPLTDVLNTLLRDSLVKTNDRIHSDSDLQILHKKIIKLMLKVSQFREGEEQLIMESLTNDVKKIIDWSKSFGTEQSLIESERKLIKTMHNLVTKTESIWKRKNFLSN
jgi:hypothetical protein